MNKLMRLAATCFLFLATLTFLVLTTERAHAQGATKWMQVGSLFNWFSEKG
jgi:hypothetical protein